MTSIEFEKEISNIYKSSNRVNRIFAIVLLILSFIFFVIILNNLSQNNNKSFGALVIPLIPMFASFLVLYLIPKQYIVIEVSSNKSVENKTKLFMDSLKHYKIKNIIHVNGYSIISCSNKYFSSFEVFILFDDKKYLFNVQSADGQTYKGVFDFGLSNRVEKRIKASLQQRV